jgi:hypothetical protein
MADYRNPELMGGYNVMDLQKRPTSGIINAITNGEWL